MFDCIIIGAGPGGLVCTKELLEQNVSNIICLEQTDKIGGVFANSYDNLVLTSSCTFSMFSDFWMGDGKQHQFWSKQEFLNYLHKYAQHFGIFEKIRFNTKVMAVIPNPDNTWKIQLDYGETLLTQRVALAIGSNSMPNYPDWKDSLTNINYSHSQEYRNANQFVGKNVLVVGGGESASDMALEISKVANQCWVSLRNSAGWILPRKRGDYAADIATHRGIYGLPREYGAYISKLICQFELSKNDPIHNITVKLNQKIQSKNGVWGSYGTKNFSLPEAIAYYNCQVVSEISQIENGGKTLITNDGEILENIDAVLFATGYQNYVSFLPENLKQTDPRSLYKHIFHPQYGNSLAWIGAARPGFGSQFPIMEMQARFFALICKGERNLPNPEKMTEIAEEDKAIYLEQFEHNAQRIRNLVDYHRYMDDLADLIGCKPPFWKYFFLHFDLWLKIVYGATNATQFRLQGTGKKETLAQEFLRKLPVSSFNHVVKAGIRGRIIYAFKNLASLLTFNFLRTE